MINQFLIFTQKEFFHIMRDRWTMIILLVLPIAMIILFGFGITTEIKNAKFAVLDLSKDHVTQGIINKLETSEYFIFEESLNKSDDIETIFQQGKIGLLVVFSERFYENQMRTGDAQIQLIADGTDPNTASMLTTIATSLIMEYQQENSTTSHIPYQIVTESKLLYNPTMEGTYNIVPGVIGMILMLVCAMMTSVSIAKEKEMGTMEVILVSPMPPILIVISKMVPYFVISMINLTSVLLIAVFILKVPIAGSLFLLVFISMLFIFVALAIGLLISTLVDTQLVALLASIMTLLMPVVMLSGLMFPIENMPIALQGFAQIIPAKWYISAMKTVMIRGLGFFDVLTEILVLIFMGIVIIAISYKKFKIRLE